MKTSVIIVEFNPFHRGHQYFIQKVRELSGADYLISVMSGDYVQRGEPALFNKYVRAEAALDAGVDLVLELPVKYSLGSAGSFASCAVKIINSLGCADELWFGSESGSIDDFITLSGFLADETPEFRSLITEELKKGSPYPAARAAVTEKLCGKKTAALLSGPNNVLGLEYCAAAARSGSAFALRTIQRKGSGYNETRLTEGFASATAVRNAYLKNGAGAVAEAVPDYAYELMRREPGGLTADDFSLLLKYRLLQESPESLCSYNEVTPDLARRIKNLENECDQFSEFAMNVKTKNITYTHVCRALLNIILGIRTDLPLSPYVRILGMKDCGPLISRISETGSAKLFSQPASVPAEVYAQDMFASDLYESVRSFKYSTPFVQECSRKFLKK